LIEIPLSADDFDFSNIDAEPEPPRVTIRYISTVRLSDHFRLCKLAHIIAHEYFSLGTGRDFGTLRTAHDLIRLTPWFPPGEICSVVDRIWDALEKSDVARKAENVR
jgi:hypothetical protein